MIDIERLQRTLESAPKCRVEEVSTLEAIRMLAPQIHAMQTKGYALGAIAEMLSGNGVPVTGATLKSYLSEVKTAGGRKSDRKRKTRRAPGCGAKVTKGAPAVTVPASPATVAMTSKGTVRTQDEVGVRRSAFVPREDTRDI